MFIQEWVRGSKNQDVGAEWLPFTITYNESPRASRVAQTVDNLPAMQAARVGSLGRKDPLEEELATHPSILAREIPWTEEPGVAESDMTERVTHT